MNNDVAAKPLWGALVGQDMTETSLETAMHAAVSRDPRPAEDTPAIIYGV